MSRRHPLTFLTVVLTPLLSTMVCGLDTRPAALGCLRLVIGLLNLALGVSYWGGVTGGELLGEGVIESYWELLGVTEGELLGVSQRWLSYLWRVTGQRSYWELLRESYWG